jgi:Sulfotransferase domain
LARSAAREEDLKQSIAKLQWDLSANGRRGHTVDDDAIARLVSPRRKHAWLVAAPKAGSTWLTRMLIHVLDWQPHSLVGEWDRREQEVDVRRMLEFPDADLFSIQQHCRFSRPTCEFIRKFRVQVILQGRNLWDSVVSLRDHFLKESTVSPVCYTDETFAGQPPERQLDAVIDLAVPWYLNFYAAWFTGQAKGEVVFLWVDYESLCGDPGGQLKRICEYLGVTHCEERIEAAICSAAGEQTRMNVGGAGRGAKMLSAAQKARIGQLRGYYPHIDFSAIGLD